MHISWGLVVLALPHTQIHPLSLSQLEQFMQRSAKNKTAEETVPGASHQAASPFDTEEIYGPPRIVVVEGGRHPLLRLGAGRRSFGGINPAIETWAILRDKDYRRAIRCFRMLEHQTGTVLGKITGAAPLTCIGPAGTQTG